MYEQPSNWYDRILDVLLGEDEALAKNRIVLICFNCRLVNGQAPPGVTSLEEVGRWKCGECHAWNGAENKAAQVLKEVRQQVQDEQVEERGNAGKSQAEEVKHVQADGVAEVDAVEERDGVQKSAREIPDSEEDDDEDKVRSEDDKGDGDGESGEDINLDERRVTRSVKKRNATKRR